MNDKIKKKSRERAITLSVLSATCLPFGLHKFYLGLYQQGILYVLFCWTLIPQIISLIEFILFIKMKDDDFDMKYNKLYVRNEIYNKVMEECKCIKSLTTEIDSSLTKDEKCFLQTYVQWHEYRKVKGMDKLELICQGNLYLTNKRIFVVSNMESKKIELKDIVDAACNKDDINIPDIVEITKIKGKNVILLFNKLEDMFKLYFMIIAYKNNLLKLNKSIES